MPEETPEIHYQQFAEVLNEMQQKENGGTGIEYVRWIVDDLRLGNIGAAKANYRNQSDKFDRFPEIKKFLKDIGIA